jgi:sugar lactone lactonase YvrE
MHRACGLLKQFRTQVFFVFLLLLPATAAAAVGLSSFTLKPSTVVQGTPSVGTVTLDGPAPTGGATVTLTSLNPAVASVPGSVVVPQGTTSAQVLVDTLAVTTPTVVTIQASYNGVFLSPQLTVTPRVAVRGVSGDLWADIIIGQPNFGDYTPHEVTNGRVFNPGGVEVDRSVQPNRVYAYDGANSRVLGLSHLGTCTAGSKQGQNCTGSSDCPSSVCNVQEGIGADLVLGQPSFTTSGCNGDSNFQNFPTRVPATASTLCGMPEYQISIGEGFSWANLAVDSAGNLYVPDFDNNRVVRYNSPFTTDTIADYVWGQADFTGNGCNRGRGNGLPDAQSFCFRSIFNDGFTGGVDIDSAGNLWVSDNANQRVLRFPKDPHTGVPKPLPDLVLGQPDFFSANPGTALNQMCAPAAVRVASDGTVYVADSGLNCDVGQGALTGRVLIFNPPIVSGMSASSVLGDGLFLNPTGLELDSTSGGFWVIDTGNDQFLFFPFGSTQPTKVLGKPAPDYSHSCNVSSYNDPYFTYADGGIAYRTVDCLASGGIGINNDGDVFISAMGNNDMWRFPAPIPLISGVPYPADKRIFLPLQFQIPNHVGPSGFLGASGLVVAGRQLILADSNRLMFWNDTSTLTNGQPADGCLGAIDAPGCLFEGPKWTELYGRITADQASHLWVVVNTNNGEIAVYSLPLSSDSTPFTTLTSPLPVLGGGNITWDNLLTVGGIASNGAGTRVWVADPNRNRVFRIRDPLTSPVVDIVLGQTSSDGTLCNQGNGRDMPSQTSLCNPGNVTLDPSGNVYVSDDAAEATGNFRLLEFDASLFPDNPSSALFAIPATRVFGRNGSFTDPNCELPSIYGSLVSCAPLDPAFTSDGQMVVGFNGYLGSRFPAVYKTPLVSDQPDTYLNDFSSYGGYSAVFDSNDDLYISDADRARVLVYRHPLPPVGPGVTLSPASLDFGPQGVRRPITPQAVTLTNSGSLPLLITNISITGPNNADFFLEADTCPLSPNTLAPGNHCIITLVFSPIETGTLSAAVTITDNAPDSPQNVPMTGIGVGGKVRPK